jgi:hypothetical protein
MKTNSKLPKSSEEVSKQAIIQQYLQSPFSISWSKMSAFVESVQTEGGCREIGV